MNVKWMQRVLSLLLALAMVLALAPAVSVVGNAADTTHSLDAGALTAFAAGAKTDFQTETLDAAGFLTAHWTAKSKVDSSKKTFADGMEATQRINFGGTADVSGAETKNVISFTVPEGSAATVKVWWVCGGDGRSMGILSDAGAVVTQTVAAEAVKDGLYVSELKLDAAGTYYLGGPEGNNYLFRVDVTLSAKETTPPPPEEDPPVVTNPTEKTFILDTTTDLTAMAAGGKADGDTEKVGTETYFTIHYSAKAKIDSSKKTFADGYVGAQRLNFGGKIAVGEKNGISFTAQYPATVTVWFTQGGDDNRQVGVYRPDGTQVAVSELAGMVKNSPYIATFELAEGGNYYIGCPVNNNNFYKIQVTEHLPRVYVLDTTADLTAMAAGGKADGDTEKAGDEGFFTIYYSAKAKIDSSKKTFADGYVGAQRLNFGGKIAVGEKNGIAFTADGKGTVDVWFTQGGDDNRQVALFTPDGTQVAVSELTGMVKNSPYLCTLSFPEAGTYFVGCPVNNNNFYKLQVTVGGAAAKPPRADWAGVAAPVIGEITQNGDELTVPVTALVDHDGGDEVIVTMHDADGKEIASRSSLKPGNAHSLSFAPKASGTYTFRAVLTREGEENKAAQEVQASFLLPLEKPAISSATSTGGGKVNVVWSQVPEAEKYEVYCGENLVGTTEGLSYEVSGLTVGESYSFTVVALRGEDRSVASAAVTAVATENAQRVWGFTRYGSSTNDANNGYVGSVNEDGKVTVYSEGGKGKIVPNSTDGVAFYYTAIPADQNFTLRAKVSVDSWTLSNGQEGFGLMAADRLGPNGNSGSFWNNQYMAIASKVEYNAGGAKYSMKLGLGALVKTGVTVENLPKLNAGDTATINEQFKSVTETLDHTPEGQGLGGGTYNIIGNATAAAPGTVAELTTFILEIQRNNTGYIVRYYGENGSLIAERKDYDPAALTQVDKDYVYVGFFASRNARATFSDVVLTTIDPASDAPAETRPITYITPSIAINSASTANSSDYVAYLNANVAGSVTVKLDGKTVAENIPVVGGVRKEIPVTLTKESTKLEAVFTPDADQDLGEYTELTGTDPVTASLTVSYSANWKDQNNLYVAPNGQSNGNGSKDYPLDIYTAIKYVRPGQTIILMEGTYALSTPVKIEHGIDGTKDQPIRMIADPEAKSRPVIDFQKKVTGITHGGDWWYFQGFDVTNSANGQKGFQVSGHNNVLDQINTYNNGNTGIQLSRYAGSDPKSEWPSNNLILNCTSYNNADAGYEDADGFAAKLTCGEGNVFDGCVAYNNADDGWDLYAKVETGPIGAVTIRNCVAYQNGYVMENGQLVKAGNGNGFKMGGESLSGKHKLINSYAFFNKAKGIDSNSCPDIIVENSTSYNNESYNVAFYTNNAANTDFAATGIVSFKDGTIKSGLTTGENLKPKGTQDTAKYLGDTNYYWDGSATKNASGKAVTADMFQSLEFKGVKRNEDGTINLQGFLQLKEDVDLNGGAAPGGSTSEPPSVTPDKPLDPPKPNKPSSPPTGDQSNVIVVMAVMAISLMALVCAIFVPRKRRA